jgi:hypothetical protein
MPRAEKTVLVLATVLITIGCVGEYIFGARANNAASQLQQASDRTVAALTAQQEADHRIAAQAAAHAADLGVTVDTIHNFVTQKENEADKQFLAFKKFASDEKTRTETVITQLNDDKANLEKSRDDAQVAAKQAESELAEMRAANAPRSMTGDQQNEFISRTIAFAGLTTNVFTPPSTTPDAGPLSELLVALLTKANWKVGSGVPIGGWAKAVLVCVGDRPQSNVADAATAIVLALRADGIPAFIDPKLGPNIPFTGAGSPLANPDMTIIVGAKQ